jgi:hypothetical protein
MDLTRPKLLKGPEGLDGLVLTSQWKPGLIASTIYEEPREFKAHMEIQ